LTGKPAVRNEMIRISTNSASISSIVNSPAATGNRATAHASLRLQRSIAICAARQCVDSENPSRSPYVDSGQGLSFGTFEPLSLKLLHWNSAQLACGHLPNKTGTQGTERVYCAALQLHEPAACFIEILSHCRSMLGLSTVNLDNAVLAAPFVTCVIMM